MTLRNIAIAIALLAATILTLVLLQRRQPPKAPRSATPPAGYYLNDAVIEGMGQDGRRLYTLSAERIVQEPSSQGVGLEVVDLEYASKDTQPWRLTAERGAIPEVGDRIELYGNVTIEETLFAGPAATVVTMPELEVDLRAHLATTDKSVRIERGRYVITATGLRADLKDQKLQLQSDVHGRFLP